MSSHETVILIVDDSASARETLEALLFNEGYRLVFAVNGPDALSIITDLRPDLILLDVMMPEMDGFEVCRRIRADLDLGEVPIIMVTALDDRESRLEGLNSGADDFISKPFDRTELKTRVRTITRLNRYRRIHDERLQFEWVVEQSPDGYLLIGDDDSIHYANPRACQLLGLPENMHLAANERFMPLILSQYRLEPESAWAGWPESSAFSEKSARYIVRPESPLSRPHWLEVTTRRGLTGNQSLRLIRLQDVTDKLDSLRSAWSFQGMISHKLRTPLNGLIGAITLLAEDIDTLPEDSREFVTIAQNSATRMEREINNILRFSDSKKLSAGPRVWIDQLPGIAAAIGTDILNQPVTVTGADSYGGRSINLTVEALESILAELFSNAKKFHPHHKPLVSISVTAADAKNIVLSVADNGTALTPEQQLQVWSPYFQGEKSFSGEVPGMGLGLTMIASLVCEAAGSYRISNRIGEPGVIVELTLPLVI